MESEIYSIQQSENIIDDYNTETINKIINDVNQENSIKKRIMESLSKISHNKQIPIKIDNTKSNLIFIVNLN